MAANAIQPAGNKSQALVPHSPQQVWWHDLQEQARSMVEGGLFRGKVQTVEQMITIGLAARDLNLGLVDAAKNIHVIQGTICMSAEIMLALVRRSERYGFRYDRSDSEACTLTIWLRKYPDESFTTTFTMDDAKAAGLTGKDTWKKYPDVMLRWRAIGNAVRAFAPEVLRKVYTPEEMGAEIDFDAGGEMVVTSLPPESTDVLPVVDGKFEVEDVAYVLPDAWRNKLVGWMVQLDTPAEVQAETLEAIICEQDAKERAVELKAAVTDMLGDGDDNG